MASSVEDFYDGLAGEYHLVYAGGWDGAVQRQGAALHRLLGAARADVLDCSCGIGTQAVGLALRGHRVHGTDLSARSVERARAEAARLGAEATFGVADFRDLSGVEGTFDVVVSCDNALPHLLDDAEITAALVAMRSKLRPGGLLVVSIRDYEAERVAAFPPLVIPGPPRRVLVRLHEWDAPDSPLYTVRFLLLTEGDDGWAVAEHAARYRAITRAALGDLAREAGFEDVVWRSGAEAGFHQPVLTARA